MLRTIMALEWRIMRRDRAALVVLALFGVFLALAAFAGGHHADRHRAGVEGAVSEEATRRAAHAEALAALSPETPLAAADPRDPVWMGQTGAATYAALPPAPLASVAVGQRDMQPQVVRITSDVGLADAPASETPMAGPSQLRTGPFDPAFLFVVLFPLVIIGLSYDLLAGERERGTLAMLLSQPISQRALVLGKAGARAIGLCAVTLVAAVGALWVAGADIAAGGLSLGLYGLALVAWAAFWFALAVLVDARGGTSASNALALVGAWLVLVVIIPGVLSAAVDALYPAPDRMALVHETREAAQEIERELVGLEGRHDRDTRARAYGLEVVEAQTALAARIAPVVAEMQTRVRERQAVVAKLRFLSPALVFEQALEDIAGSGAVRQARFDDQVQRFHEAWRAWFTARVRSGEPLTAVDLPTLPRFAFVEEPTGDLVSRVGAGIGALALLAVLLVGLALPRLRRIGRLSA